MSIGENEAVATLSRAEMELNSDETANKISTHPTNDLIYLSTASSGPNANQLQTAASLLTSTGQNLGNGSTNKRKRPSGTLHEVITEMQSSDGTSIACNSSTYQQPTPLTDLIRRSPPSIPATLLKSSGSAFRHSTDSGSAKLKILLNLLEPEANQAARHTSCVTVDRIRRQISLLDPSTPQDKPGTQSHGRAIGPKLFAFDEIFTAEDRPMNLYSSALAELLQAVVGGSDGCLLYFGDAKTAKCNALTGEQNSSDKIGILPCAVSWLFRLIAEQKAKTGARFSVRVSAVEVDSQDDTLRDLLDSLAHTSDAAAAGAPSAYLREGLSAADLQENYSELRSPSAEKAALYLDAALVTRNENTAQNPTRVTDSLATSAQSATTTHSKRPDDNVDSMEHLFLTLHVYQYRIERCGAGSGVSGGRSRLHIIDLGSGRWLSEERTASKSTQPNSSSEKSAILTRTTLASTLLSLIAGQRHIPQRNSKLLRLLFDAMGNVSCQMCLLIEISSSTSCYKETLRLLEFSHKVQRYRKRQQRYGFPMSANTSSEDSSSCDSFGLRRASRLRLPLGRYGIHAGYGATKLLTDKYNASRSIGFDPNELGYTSSSEQSCDTVIYLGRHECRSNQRESAIPGVAIATMSRVPDSLAEESVSDTPQKSAEKLSVHQEDELQHEIITKNSNETPKIESIPSKSTSKSDAKRALVKTSTHVWRRAAAKNAVETLSTQKELWVDGPKAQFSPRKSATTGVLTSLVSQASPQPFITMVDKETQVVELEKSPGMDCTAVNKIVPDRIDVTRGQSYQRVQSCSNFHWGRQKFTDKHVDQKPEQSGGEISTEANRSQLVCSKMQLHLPQSVTEPKAESKERHGRLRNAVDTPQLITNDQSPLPRLSVQADVPQVAYGLHARGSTNTTQRERETNNVDQTSATLCDNSGTKHSVNPFVKDWLYKHSGVISHVPDSEQPARAHPLANSGVHREQSSQPLIGAPVECTDHIQQFIQPEHSRTAVVKDVKNSNCMIKNEAAHRVLTRASETEALVKQASSNFARIAEWVKSVSMEICENKTDAPTPNAYLASSGIFPQLYSVLPMNSQVQDVYKLLLEKQRLPIPNSFASMGVRHWPVTPQLPQGPLSRNTHHDNKGLTVQTMCAGECCFGLEECESRRGQSVPPRNLRQFTYAHSQSTGHPNYTNDSVTQPRGTLPIVSEGWSKSAIKEETNDITNAFYSRRPDGSSNPHLHKEHEFPLTQRLGDQPTRYTYFTGHENVTSNWNSTDKFDSLHKYAPKTVKSTSVSQHRQLHYPLLCANLPHWNRKHLPSECVEGTSTLPLGQKDGPSPEHGNLFSRPRAHSFGSSADSFIPCYSCEVRRCAGSGNCERAEPLDGVCAIPKDHSARKPRENVTKVTKNRLRFFTSPLFGKRKRHSLEKTNKHSRPELTNTMVQPHAKMNGSGHCFFLPQHPGPRSTAGRGLSSQSGEQSSKQTMPGTPKLTQLECKFSQDDSDRKHVSADRSVMSHSSPTCVGNQGIIRRTVSSCRNTLSMQSSSGHGSECSGKHASSHGPTETKQSPETQCYIRRQSQQQRHRHSNANHSHHRRRCDPISNQSNSESQVVGDMKNLTGMIPSMTADCVLKTENNRLTSAPEAAVRNPYTLDPNAHSHYSLTAAKSRFPVSESDSMRTRKGGGHTSSGYESILRDSEASSHGESTSGSSVSELGSKTGNAPSKQRVTVLEEETVQHNRVKPMSVVCQNINVSSVHSVNAPATSLHQHQVPHGKYDELRLCPDDSILTTQHTIQHTHTKMHSVVQNEIDLDPAALPENDNRIRDNLLTASSSSSNSRRSRSAPPCSESTSEETTSSPISVRYIAPKTTQTTTSSIDTSQSGAGYAKEEEEENPGTENATSVAGLQVCANKSTWQHAYSESGQAAKRSPGAEEMMRQILFEKIYGLLAQQEMLKMELVTAKEHLMADPATWNFGLYVAEHMDPNEAGFLKALEQETDMLRRRVDACKSHIMMITCFDSSDN